MSEQEKPKRKQVEREYIIELLDGTKRVQTETNLSSAKWRAEQNYPGQVKDVRRADGIERKHDPRYPDRTRNERTKDREEGYTAMAARFGYPSKSAVLTALLNGEAVVVKVEKE